MHDIRPNVGLDNHTLHGESSPSSAVSNVGASGRVSVVAILGAPSLLSEVIGYLGT
jgi:hypothetical protein